MTDQSNQPLFNKEHTLQLAIEAYNNKQFRSIRAAANAFNVHFNTMACRMRGAKQPRSLAQQNNKKLTSVEEATLTKWILDLYDRGYPAGATYIKQMASHILSKRVGKKTEVGMNWTSRFVKRSNLKTKYYRRYDYARAVNEDPNAIKQWFDLFNNMVKKYGTPPSEIWNFDESGFAMGVKHNQRVVCSQNASKPTSIQAGNKEWVTTIDAINANGAATAPLFIFKGKYLQERWFHPDQTERDWSIVTSTNGWTTDDITLGWLRNVFQPHSNKLRTSVHRILVMDGHGSHHTAEFDATCQGFNIIPVYVPPHSSHLLQPLDVGIFGPLKQAYSKELDTRSRLGINHVDKSEFLSAYKMARPAVFTRSNILGAFKGAGLVPLDSGAVLNKLTIKKAVPSSPINIELTSSPYQPKMPYTSKEAHKQTEHLNAQFNEQTAGSAIDPTLVSAVGHISKGLNIMAAKITILEAENDALRVANNRQKRKQAESKKQIGSGGIMTAAEAQNIINASNTDSIDQARFDRPTTVKNKCSVCKLEGHNARTCIRRRI